jgi:SAM-dependent methyltransferase
MEVVGVDLSPDFVALARAAADERGLDVRFEEMDVRDLPFDGEFDAVVCLCQGGFGLLRGDDEQAIGPLARALRPGGRLALSAFSAAFAVAHLESGESFDVETGVFQERATLRDPAGTEREFDLWTTCFTPRELRLVARAAGLHVDAVHGVAPGRYAAEPPSLDAPEHLLLARRGDALEHEQRDV